MECVSNDRALALRWGLCAIERRTTFKYEGKAGHDARFGFF